MNTPTDAAAAVIRQHMNAKVAEIKADLESWIARRTGPEREEPGHAFPAYYVEMSNALLETAIDRYIRLHGATDTFELIESSFRRQAEKFGVRCNDLWISPAGNSRP